MTYKMTGHQAFHVFHTLLFKNYLKLDINNPLNWNDGVRPGSKLLIKINMMSTLSLCMVLNVPSLIMQYLSVYIISKIKYKINLLKI